MISIFNSCLYYYYLLGQLLPHYGNILGWSISQMARRKHAKQNFEKCYHLPDPRLFLQYKRSNGSNFSVYNTLVLSSRRLLEYIYIYFFFFKTKNQNLKDKKTNKRFKQMLQDVYTFPFIHSNTYNCQQTHMRQKRIAIF